MRRVAVLAGGVAALLVLASALAAVAANPASGSVSASSPSAGWSGQFFAAGAVADPAACPQQSDPGNARCDHFTLNVAGPLAKVAVNINWPSAGDDFDLYIFKNGTQVASSATGGGNSESVTIPNADGAYEVRVVPFLVTQSGYSGKATVTDATAGGGNGGTAPGGPAAYHGTAISGDNPAVAPQNTSTPYTGPQLVLRTTDVGRKAAEPTIGVDKDGVAFYAASTFDSVVGEARTVILRSTDQNTSWQSVQPTVAGQDQHPQTLDPYLYVDPDTNRVFFDDLLLVGGSELSTSDDKGKTYTTSFANDALVNDHQSIVTAKVPAGSGLTTVGYSKITYECVNQIANVQCSRSLDGGKTFTPTPGVPFPGHTVPPPAGNGNPLCSSLTGHLASDRDGRIFLGSAFNSCGPPRLAISDDAGNTFRESVISAKVGDAEHEVRTSADAAGNIYATWDDDKHHLPYLAISRDHGATWGAPVMIAPPGVQEVNFPSVEAGADGRVAVSFPGTTVADRENKARPWNYYVVVSTDATGANPTFVSNIANPSSDPIHRGDCQGRCAGMLDFLDVTVEPNAATGGPVWATAVDTCTSQDGCNSTDPDKGKAGSATDMRGLAIREISGPALLGDAPALPTGPSPSIPEERYPALLPVLVAMVGAAALLVRRRRVTRAGAVIG